MSRLKYTSAWSRPLKPAPPEAAAATMVQPLGHACSGAFLRPSEILKPPRRSEILKFPRYFGYRSRLFDLLPCYSRSGPLTPWNRYLSAAAVKFKTIATLRHPQPPFISRRRAFLTLAVVTAAVNQAAAAPPDGTAAMLKDTAARGRALKF